MTTRVGASHLSKGARVDVDAVAGVAPPEPTVLSSERSERTDLAADLLDYTTDFSSAPDGTDGPPARRHVVPGRRPVVLKMALSLLFLVGMIGAGFVVGGGLGGSGGADTAAPAPAPSAVSQTGDLPSLDAWDPPSAPAETTVATEASPDHTAFAEAAANLAADLAAEPVPTSATVPAPTSTVPLTVARAAAPTTPKPTPTTAKPVPTTVKVAPTTSPAPTAPPATSPPASGGQAATLACIRQRESGGNYSIVSAGGTYMGAYQFAQSTWNSTANHAGRPDLVGVRPNLASPADQDALALHLLNWQGLAPWGGYCG